MSGVDRGPLNTTKHNSLDESRLPGAEPKQRVAQLQQGAGARERLPTACVAACFHHFL